VVQVRFSRRSAQRTSTRLRARAMAALALGSAGLALLQVVVAVRSGPHHAGLRREVEGAGHRADASIPATKLIRGCRGWYRCDSGSRLGNDPDKTEVVAARKRIRELEAKLALRFRAIALLREAQVAGVTAWTPLFAAQSSTTSV
jgi:hypothetical protein